MAAYFLSALNSVEAREGILLSFLDENHGNIIVILSCFVWKMFFCLNLKFIVVVVFFSFFLSFFFEVRNTGEPLIFDWIS